MDTNVSRRMAIPHFPAGGDQPVSTFLRAIAARRAGYRLVGGEVDAWRWFLGASRDQAAALLRAARREFSWWPEETRCDLRNALSMYRCHHS